MIAVIDYGVGNLFSLSSSLAYLGLENKITRSARELDEASHIIPVSYTHLIITQADAISELYALLSELPVSDRKTEPVAGGAVTSFRFNLSDHTSYEIIYCAEAVKKGRLKLPAEQQDYFTSADIGCLLYTSINRGITLPRLAMTLP